MGKLYVNLSSCTRQYHSLSPQRFSDGGHYHSTNLSNLASDRCIQVYVGDYDDGFYVQLYETTALAARPQSARIKKPRKRQLTRAVLANVAPIDCYDTIEEAVREAAAKLRERYSEKYKATLEAPLESVITTELRANEAQPPGEA